MSGNIFDYLEGKDLIVNSANQYMIYGSGVCGAIYKMADKDLLEQYCKEHFKENMKVNEIRITPGFNIGIDVLHIYCPKYYQGEDSINKLLESYNNIFISAKENNYNNGWFSSGSIWYHPCPICRVWWCDSCSFVAGNF